MHHTTLFTSVLTPPLLHSRPLSLRESPLRYPVGRVALHTGSSMFVGLLKTLGHMMMSFLATCTV